MKLNLIKSWDDKVYGVINRLYSFENGTRLLHTIKPRSREFYSSVVVVGGSYFEKQLKVPEGTAHFLEHMLCRPNKFLKTKEEYDKYCFGDRNNPTIYRNASTNFQNIFFYSEGNKNASERIVDLNRFRIDYPDERLEEFIEMERGIIQSENSSYLKEDRSKGLQFSNFIQKNEYPEYTCRIVGSQKSIKKITLRDIKSYKSNVFNSDNIILTVQSDSDLSEKIIDSLHKTSLCLGEKKTNLKVNYSEMKNKLRFGHFQDPDMQSVNLNVIFLSKRNDNKVLEDEDYLTRILLNITKSLLYYLGFEKLREEKSLIYSMGTFSDPINWHWNEEGYYINCELEKLDEATIAIQEIFYNEMIPFLENGRGQTWLENEISYYIYKLNQNYNPDYTDSIASRILRTGAPYVWDESVGIKLAKKIQIIDVIEFIKAKLYKDKPHVWAISPYEEKQVMSILKKNIK